jgi:hypothetical protein
VFIGSALLSARERDYGTMYLFSIWGMFTNLWIMSSSFLKVHGTFLTLTSVPGLNFEFAIDASFMHRFIVLTKPGYGI